MSSGPSLECPVCGESIPIPFSNGRPGGGSWVVELDPAPFEEHLRSHEQEGK